MAVYPRQCNAVLIAQFLLREWELLGTLLFNFVPQVDVFGAGASLADTDVVFDQCLSVLRQIYTSLHLHCKYVCGGLV